MLVYDITVQESFDFCRSQLERLSAVQVKCLVGTHRDKSQNRCIQYAQAVELKDKYEGVWGEVGKNDAQNSTQLKQKLQLRALFAVQQLVEAKTAFKRISESQMRKNEDTQMCEVISDNVYGQLSSLKPGQKVLVEKVSLDKIE